MKARVSSYLPEHVGTELNGYQYLEVELDGGRVLDVVPHADHVELRSRDGVLLAWPRTSNVLLVEPLDPMESPGHGTRSMSGHQASRLGGLSAAAGDLADVALRLLEHVEAKGGQMPHAAQELRERVEAVKRFRQAVRGE